MSEYYNVVPWYNSAEWNSVYEQLTSESPNKDNVLNQLLIWKARCPSLPSGIESTLTLLQVYVQDQNSFPDVNTDQILRLAYSSAVMRFVNHMLDTETAKGGSLYRAAKNLGVPDWIIDLRHDTAHSNNLPSIELLRDATVIGLNWLKKNYWEKHQPHVQDYISGQREENVNEENRIAVLMNFCTSLSICAHPKCYINNLSAIPDHRMRESIISDAKDLFGDKIDMSNLKTVSLKTLINSLNERCHKFLQTNNTAFYVNKALLAEDSPFLSFELLNFMDKKSFNKNQKLSSSYVQCFELLLTYLHTNDLLLNFILALIKLTQTVDNNKRALLVALWLSEILSALRRCRDFKLRLKKLKELDISSKKRQELKLLFQHWFPNEKSNLVLDFSKPAPAELTDMNFIKPIISSYNPYLIYFVKDLLNLLEPKLPTVVSDKICKLAKLISTPDKFPKPLTTRIYTEDDLKSSGSATIEIDEDVSKLENVNNEAQQVTGIWRLASKEHSWGTYPIGQLPWKLTPSVDIQVTAEDVQMMYK